MNGESRSVEAPADMPLLWVLRDRLGLTGTKYGCGVGVCGACTVHVDGRAERSCQVARRRRQRRRDHDDRGPLARRQPSRAAGVARGGRGAVRLLPAGDDPERRRRC